MDMEIIDGLEVNTKTFGKTYFRHTKFVLQRKDVEDDYYVAVAKCRFADATPAHIRSMKLTKIPNNLIFPMYAEGLTVAPDPLPYNVYIKSPKLLHFGLGEGQAPPNMAARLLNEAQICEALVKNPHPNVARYHGCIVKDGFIKGLVFTRYSLNLNERAAESIPIKIDPLVKLIKKGVKHLHSMGLAHNHIHPTNIMLRDDDQPVIIDFSSVLAHGQALEGWGAGAPPWIPPEATKSDEYNDHYALQQIYHWLRT